MFWEGCCQLCAPCFHSMYMIDCAWVSLTAYGKRMLDQGTFVPILFMLCEHDRHIGLCELNCHVLQLHRICTKNSSYRLSLQANILMEVLILRSNFFAAFSTSSTPVFKYLFQTSSSLLCCICAKTGKHQCLDIEGVATICWGSSRFSIK